MVFLQLGVSVKLGVCCAKRWWMTKRSEEDTATVRRKKEMGEERKRKRGRLTASSAFSTPVSIAARWES
jgi:hypothetical protein